jgi:hypothetical protein
MFGDKKGTSETDHLGSDAWINLRMPLEADNAFMASKLATDHCKKLENIY